MELFCSSCNKTKDENFFSKKPSSKSRGFSYKCKICHNDYMRDVWYKKNSAKHIKSVRQWESKNLNSKLSYRYKVSVEEMDHFISTKENTCEICKKESKLVVDHCHSSGQLRGWLCSPCNIALGLLKDDCTSMRSAIRYLRRNKI